MAEIMFDLRVFEDISGNWLCLDFTHTLNERHRPDKHELLQSYRDLLTWGLYMGILTDEEAQQLSRVAEQHPLEASTAFEDAVGLREAIYRIFYAIVEGSEPRRKDMALLNAMLRRAMAHARVEAKDGGYVWDWDPSEDALDVILWHVARSAAGLLTSEKLQDVRACAADDCRWLFLDTSKNHSRRWCDMETCGNQAKARRHYIRKKSASM